MSRAADDKIRERKSKAKLDRLLDIKKAIMESLHLLSRPDRSGGQMKKNCPAPPAGYRLCQAPDWFPLNRVDVVRRPDNAFHVVPVLMDPNSQLQNSCQTWPQDMYFGKSFGDGPPEPTPPPHLAQISARKDCAQIKAHAVDYRLQEELAPADSVYLEQARLAGFRQGYEKTMSTDYCEGTRLNAGKTEPHPQSLQSYQSRASANASPRHQEVQTDPEVARPRDPDYANADIVRYLNQINDKAFGRRYPTEPPRRSACFSPRYDTYEERFCYRLHGPHCVAPERLYRSREYAALPTPPDFRRDADGGRHFLGYTGPLRHDAREHGCAAFTGDHHNTPLSETVRSPSDDSGSVFSSETDSDFIFYPCTSLADSFKCMALVDSRNGSFLSPPGDLPENVQSWRSEIFGSSLDDITQQFFYDDDVLSDDVFLDETRDYPAYANESLLGGCGSFREAASTHSFENPLYDSPKLTRPTIWSLQDEQPGECDYTYRYDDIDEVLQGYDHHSACRDDDSARADMGGVTCFRVDPADDEIHFDTDETSAAVVVSPGAGSRHSSDTAADELHVRDDRELANVLDSLRRNSTQSKARKMWRQRRARAKKNLKSGHGEAVTSPSALVFKFVAPAAPATGDEAKPLKGILKNKGGVSPAVHDADVVINSARDITFAPNTNDVAIEQCAEYDMDQGSSSPEAHDGDARVKQGRAGTAPCGAQSILAPNDIRGASRVQLQQDKFHFVPTTHWESGQQDVVAVRKNSVDIVRWNQSLQRRKKRHARKAEMSAHTATL